MKQVIFSNKLQKTLNDIIDGNSFGRMIAYQLMYSDANGTYPCHAEKAPHHITIREDGMISYMPYGKEQELTTDGRWAMKNRQMCKPSRLPKLMFRDEILKMFSPKEIESFNDEFKQMTSSTTTNEKYRIVIYDGDDIGEMYGYDKYPDENNSTLWNSCMRSKESGFFMLYNKCKNVSLVTVMSKRDLNKEAIYARALLWKTTDGTLFMDRIYNYDNASRDMLIKYALENNIMYKEKQSSETKFTAIRGVITIDDDGDETIERVSCTPKIVVKIGSWFNRRDITEGNVMLPYLDTLKYLMRVGEDWYLSNAAIECDEMEAFELSDTNGDTSCRYDLMRCYITQKVCLVNDMRDIIIDATGNYPNVKYRYEYISCEQIDELLDAQKIVEIENNMLAMVDACVKNDYYSSGYSEPKYLLKNNSVVDVFGRNVFIHYAIKLWDGSHVHERTYRDKLNKLDYFGMDTIYWLRGSETPFNDFVYARVIQYNNISINNFSDRLLVYGQFKAWVDRLECVNVGGDFTHVQSIMEAHRLQLEFAKRCMIYDNAEKDSFEAYYGIRRIVDDIRNEARESYHAWAKAQRERIQKLINDFIAKRDASKNNTGEGSFSNEEQLTISEVYNDDENDGIPVLPF